MGLPHMPTYGCEHLTEDHVSKINKWHKTTQPDPDFVQYTCISCPTQGGFKHLDNHFAESKHQFASSSKAVYCGACHDLVYDYSILAKGESPRKRKAERLTEEDEQFISQNTSQRPCGREGVRGFFNLGETCYMNAVLQMMVHNKLLQTYFLGMGHPLHTCPISKEPEKKNDSDDSDDELNGEEKEQKTCVACGMTEIFSDAAAVDQTLPAHAVNLLFASWKNIPHMSGKQQQDAQEWFMIIVDKLHEAVTNPLVTAANSHSFSSNSVNGVDPKDPEMKNQKAKHCWCFFHKVFYGRFYSDITCETCHKVTTTEEEFSSMSLDFKKQAKRKKKEANVKKESDSKDNAKDGHGKSDSKTKISLVPPSAAAAPNLYDCLKAYTAPESLTADNYTCPSCKTPRAATKRLRVRKLPTIFCVHVKRFGMKKIGGIVSNIAEKYEGKLDFPLVLDMGPYTTASLPIPVNGKHAANGTKNDSSSGAGHANGNARDAPGSNKYIYDLDCVVVHQGEHSHTGHYYAYCRKGTKWYKFDDEIVSATTTEDVLRQEAYLLFYGLRELRGPTADEEKDD